MSCLGTGEMITLIVVVLIIFSASRMSQLGNAVGRFVHSFKKASKGEGFVDAKPLKRVEGPVEDAEVVDVTPKKDPPPSA